MKTKISTIAAVTLFALFIFVGNADAKGTEFDAPSHESNELTLELEDWMTDSNFWDTEDNLVIETTFDEALHVENWMTNTNIWDFENAISLETEKEEILTFEPWMTDENIWNR